MADEGLREIQLNGKQLVFLFMASTVVAVVIFLCGVMVGRGVRVQAARELADAPDAVLSDPTITPSDSVRATARKQSPHTKWQAKQSRILTRFWQNPHAWN